MTQTTVAAADLGASSGRVMTGRVGADRLELREVHRFPNRPVAVLGTLHWDILRLYADLLDGLAAAARDGKLASIGIDSWGVDYGLIGAGGALLGNPVHYRDARTSGVLDQVLAAVPAAELYAVTGVQLLQINTVCQLVAASRAGAAGRRGGPAADPRPAGVLADRRGRGGADQRLDHAAVRPAGQGLGLGGHRAS